MVQTVGHDRVSETIRPIDAQIYKCPLIFSDKPICSNLHRVVQGVGRDRVSKIVCPIDAHPPPLDYAWTFNSSLETHTVSQESIHIVRKRK